MALILPTICLFACTLTLYFETKNLYKLTVKTKLLASLAFVGFAWEQGAWQTTYGQLIFTGLTLSLVGDVLLVIKGRSSYFLSGIAAFLLAHCIYAWAFMTTGFNAAQLPVTLPAVMIFMIITSWWLRTHLTRLFKVAVPAYLLAIGSMLVMAWGSQSDQGWLWIVSGASLFAVSDLFVARQRFTKPHINNRIIGLPLYYIAQLLLAYSTTQVL